MSEKNSFASLKRAQCVERLRANNSDFFLVRSPRAAGRHPTPEQNQNEANAGP
jgi:hypothetical protein